jgi:hypothetical protein
MQKGRLARLAALGGAGVLGGKGLLKFVRFALDPDANGAYIEGMKREATMANEDKATVDMALGRIFQMMSRPERSGDVAEYERCRAIVLDIVAPAAPEYRPNYARDHSRGSR